MSNHGYRHDMGNPEVGVIWVTLGEDYMGNHGIRDGMGNPGVGVKCVILWVVKRVILGGGLTTITSTPVLFTF